MRPELPPFRTRPNPPRPRPAPLAFVLLALGLLACDEGSGLSPGGSSSAPASDGGGSWSGPDGSTPTTDASVGAMDAAVGATDGAVQGPDASTGGSSPDAGTGGPGAGGTDDVYGTTVAREGSFWVDGARLMDGSTEFELRGVNWFGLETTERALHGLWSGRKVADFLAQVKGLGFNALRIPVSRDSIRPGYASASWASHDGVDTGREQLEELLGAADAAGLRVLLDIHTCDAAISGGFSGSPEACSGYSLDDWKSDLASLATLAKSHGSVVGIDLFNEPHNATWSRWRELVAMGARAVLGANPRILVFVEGVGDLSDAGGYAPFWGENLSAALTAPVDVPRSRLVFAPHVYGPSVYRQPYFSDASFPSNMTGIWDVHFGHVRKSGYPIAIGEFGGRYDTSGSPTDQAWQDAFVAYLRASGIRHSFYWCLNPNSGDTGGILLDDWKTVDTRKTALLQRLWQ